MSIFLLLLMYSETHYVRKLLPLPVCSHTHITCACSFSYRSTNMELPSAPHLRPQSTLLLPSYLCLLSFLRTLSRAFLYRCSQLPFPHVQREAVLCRTGYIISEVNCNTCLFQGQNTAARLGKQVYIHECI
jgi:hypothetical protein